MRRIFNVQIRLEWVTDGYGWVTVVAPILVASPVYFAGDISFGGLMMAVGAFNQVHSSLRWFINNIGAIADWRATLLRVAAFRRALVEADVLHDTERRIEFFENADDSLTFDGLEVVSTAGCTMLAEPRVEIEAGEHVLITGDPGAGKTLLFRALGRPLAVGRRPDRPACRRNDHLRAENAVLPSRHAARRAFLSARRRWFRRRRSQECARQGRS